MVDIRKAREVVIARALEGEGVAKRAHRRAAFDNRGAEKPLASLIDKVAMCAFRISDEDIAAVRASGRSEDEIFEIVVCAALGQATRQYDAALAALEAATEKGTDGAPHNPR